MQQNGNLFTCYLIWDCFEACYMVYTYKILLPHIVASCLPIVTVTGKGISTAAAPQLLQYLRSFKYSISSLTGLNVA